MAKKLKGQVQMPPNDYYTKAEIDEKLAAYAPLDNPIFPGAVYIFGALHFGEEGAGTIEPSGQNLNVAAVGDLKVGSNGDACYLRLKTNGDLDGQFGESERFAALEIADGHILITSNGPITLSENQPTTPR